MRTAAIMCCAAFLAGCGGGFDGDECRYTEELSAGKVFIKAEIWRASNTCLSLWKGEHRYFEDKPQAQFWCEPMRKRCDVEGK